ncbi:hypothetical protein GJ496_006586, partial [Pomphorhynchus laevis]
GLGVPFNVTSYSLLTHILAKLADLQAFEFIHTLGDAHVYENHIEPLKEQKKRTPLPMPTIKIMLDSSNSIDDISEDKIELLNYNPLPKINMQMAV